MKHQQIHILKPGEFSVFHLEDFKRFPTGQKENAFGCFLDKTLFPFCRKSWHFKTQPTTDIEKWCKTSFEFVLANALTSPQRPDRACWKVLNTWKNSGSTLPSLIQSNAWTHCTSATILALCCILGYKHTQQWRGHMRRVEESCW